LNSRVRSSGAVTSARASNREAMVELAFLSSTDLQANTTSCADRAEPSENLVPSLSFVVHVRPSKIFDAPPGS